MKRIKLVQRSEEWFLARAGIPTASEFGNLVTDLFKARKGQMPLTYLRRKLAERWLHAPLQSFGGGGGDMEQGSILEDEALPWLAFDRQIELEPGGFCLSDDGRIGCSPDAMYPDSLMGVECKCPRADTHVGYLLDGGLPPEYGPQVQGSMLVTGADRWTFLSYCRGFPPLVLEVPRDPAAIDVLTEVLAEFCADLDSAWEALVEIAGEPPEPYAPLTHDPERTAAVLDAAARFLETERGKLDQIDEAIKAQFPRPRRGAK